MSKQAGISVDESKSLEKNFLNQRPSRVPKLDVLIDKFEKKVNGGAQGCEWKELLEDGARSASQLAQRTGLSAAHAREIENVTRVYPMFINGYILQLLEHPAVWAQFVPSAAELRNGNAVSPLAEERDMISGTSLIHRYPDRALLLATSRCAAYCRFCTRKRIVGRDGDIAPGRIGAALRYVARHNEAARDGGTRIRDIIISGGDPLLLEDSALEILLRCVRAIPGIEIVRIGTRVPSTLPQRITRELCALLREFRSNPALWINVHFEHPAELTPAARAALGALADAGIPLGNQNVLLRGINDDPATMTQLYQALLTCRVRPYYLYQCDPVRGAEHFRAPTEEGLAIMRALEGWTSGLARPHFVIDTPGGGGKVELVPPQNIVETNEKSTKVRNYKGDVYIYPEPSSGNWT